MTILGSAPIWETALHTQLKTLAGKQRIEDSDTARTFAAIWWHVLNMPNPDDLRIPFGVPDQGSDDGVIANFATLLNNLREDGQPALSGVLYGWSQPCKDTVQLAANSLPSDVVLTADMLPSASGFFAFEPPIRTDLNSGFVWEAAICWKSDDVGAVFYFVFEAISRFADDPDPDWDGVDFSVRPCPIWALAWPFGVSLGEVRDWLTADMPVDADVQQFGNSRFFREALWLIAAFIWLKQRILVDAPQHVERHARKRIARQYGTVIDRQVRVIQLRAAEPTETPEGSRHYIHQWIVSAHWRRQYYPSSTTHRLKFIAPHIKGPAGAPLKSPKSTVFEVKR